MLRTHWWLYENYAEPLMKELEKSEKEELDRIAESLQLTAWDKVQLIDHMTILRYRWGAEVFALGLQLGVRLTAPAGHERPL